MLGFLLLAINIAYFNKNNGVWKYAYYNLLTGMYAVAAQGHKANFLIFHNRVNLDDIRYYHVNNIIYYPVRTVGRAQLERW